MVAAPDREEIANENNAATTKALVAFFIKSGLYVITRRWGRHPNYPASQNVVGR